MFSRFFSSSLGKDIKFLFQASIYTGAYFGACAGGFDAMWYLTDPKRDLPTVMYPPVVATGAVIGGFVGAVWPVSAPLGMCYYAVSCKEPKK